MFFCVLFQIYTTTYLGENTGKSHISRLGCFSLCTQHKLELLLLFTIPVSMSLWDAVIYCKFGVCRVMCLCVEIVHVGGGTVLLLQLHFSEILLWAWTQCSPSSQRDSWSDLSRISSSRKAGVYQSTQELYMQLKHSTAKDLSIS